MTRQRLNASARVSLDASGTGRLELGPDTGPPYWRVLKLLVKTDRPGQAPVPECSVYQDTEDDSALVASTYDGSKDESPEDFEMQRGQHLIAVWSGGQAGDTAVLSVTGWKDTTPDGLS